MNKIKSILLTSAVAVASFAQALTIEVLPYKLEAGVEVMGLQVRASGKGAVQNAVILSGAAAADVANAAGIVVDTSTQALLLTGREVSSLVVDSLDGVHTAGRSVFIHSVVFADRALAMSLNIVKNGVYDVLDLGAEMSQTAANLTRALYNTAGKAVVEVTETGAAVVTTGAYILGSTVNLIGNVIADVLGGIFGF